MGERRGLVPDGMTPEQQAKAVELNKRFDDRYKIVRKASGVAVVLKGEGDVEVDPQRFLKSLAGSAEAHVGRAQNPGSEESTDNPRKIHARGTDSDIQQWAAQKDLELLAIAEERLKDAGVNVDASYRMAA